MRRATPTVWIIVIAALIPTLAISEPLTKEQGDAILSELKAIRSLLEKQAAAPGNAPRQAPAAAQQFIKLPDAKGHASLGRTDAPVTIVEFTDLQCPYCARFSAQSFPAIRKDFIDKGMVRFESHDLPLSFHQFAVPAAIAARCAGEQHKYWEFRELLFQRQKELANSPYDSIAAGMGISIERFQACRQSAAVAAAVAADGAAANAAGITGTPTFLIGKSTTGEFTGEKLSGAQPVSAFESKIKALLTTK